MLVVPADVPLATGDEIAAVLAGHGAPPAVTLVSDRRHKGTNALACSPPDAIPTCFGRRSFAGHRQLARERGIAARVLSLAGLALDVDTPDDLRLLLAHPPIRRTHAVLEDRGIARRLRDAVAVDDREGASACRQFAGGGLP
jgi:2-phospho-L-lactate guanylyltransferase